MYKNILLSIIFSNTGCVYFEIGDKYLKLCDIESEGKIEITIKDNIDYITDLDVAYKIDLRNTVLLYTYFIFPELIISCITMLLSYFYTFKLTHM